MSRDTYWTYSQGPELFTVGNSAAYNTATVATERGWARTTDLTGTAASSGTAVTGTDTLFTTELRVGSKVFNGGQERTVTAIASDTALTTDAAFNPALSGASVLRIDEIMVAIGQLATKTTDAVTVPVFTAVAPADGNYETGDSIILTVNASEAVEVIGSPYVVLTIGSTARNAVYDAATSTTTALKFNYLVVEGDLDTNGIAVATNITLGATGKVNDTIIGGGGVAVTGDDLAIGSVVTTGVTVNVV